MSRRPIRKKTTPNATKKAGSNTNAKKTGDTTDAQQVPEVPEVKEPFTLALYETGGKGVVETSKVPKKKRVKGAKCLLPLPIDYYDGVDLQNVDPERKFMATIIQFGCKYDLDQINTTLCSKK